MLLPLKDINPTRHRPWATYALVAANVFAFLWQQSAGLATSIYAWGLIPARLLGGADTVIPIPEYGRVLIQSDPLSTLFTSMFMHGGWLHLAGNMLYLWIFGNNVEDRLGPLNFLAFYLVGGVAAAFTHIAVSGGAVVPMVGASGAVAAVLGAYWRMYPRARVKCLLFIVIFVTFLELPASLVLGWWLVLQVVNGLLGLGGGVGGGVAWFAHIGGFAAGVLLWRLLRGQPRGSLRWAR